MENSDEANQFLTWMLPRVNYKSLSNRLKYAESGSKVVLFDYFYPKKIGKDACFVDMVPMGTTIHELLTNDSSVKHVMDKMFCPVDGMQWYTRRKVMYAGNIPRESETVRQVILVVQSARHPIDTTETETFSNIVIPTWENFILDQGHE